jgi:hypothetical protein
MRQFPKNSGFQIGEKPMSAGRKGPEMSSKNARVSG